MYIIEHVNKNTCNLIDEEGNNILAKKSNILVINNPEENNKNEEKIKVVREHKIKTKLAKEDLLPAINSNEKRIRKPNKKYQT